MDVSIVLVNYKTSSLCHDVVNSIIKMTEGIFYEIIIVDNSDSDEEFQKLNDLRGRAKVINANGNLGFGQGNNSVWSNFNVIHNYRIGANHDVIKNFNRATIKMEMAEIHLVKHFINNIVGNK